MGTTFALLTGMLLAPGQVTSDLTAINQREIQIPITFDAARKKEIRELLLFMTRSQSERWEVAARETADKDFFTYKASEDGIYWFSMMIVDKKGGKDPEDINAAPPGLKILIDTKAPIINIKSAERVGEDVVVTWDIQEAYPNLSTFKLEYKGNDGKWYRSDAQAVLSGSARIPRGVAAGITQVRLEMADLAKNRGDSGTKDVTEGTRSVSRNEKTEPSNLVPLKTISGDVPGPDLPSLGGPSLTGETFPPKAPPVIAETTPKNATTRETGPVTDPRNELSSPLTPNERQLPNVQAINVSRFDLAFDVESRGPSGVSKALLWVTRDDGKNWRQWKEYERAESSIEVDLDVKGNTQLEGGYGFKISLISGGGLSKGQPKGGDLPDMRVDVDLTPPEIQMYEPIPDSKERDTLLLRWKAFDRNMSSDPITLEWSEKKEGPWNAIATNDIREASFSGGPPARRLPNIGSHAWKVGTNVPARVYLKITARDTAGNIAEAVTPNPILVDLSKPEAKIQGIIGTGVRRKE